MINKTLHKEFEMKRDPAHTLKREDGGLVLNQEMGELLLRFNFSPVPTRYCGYVIASLGELYKHATGDDLVFVAAEEGSLTLKMRAMKRHLEPFCKALGRVVGRWLTPERIEQVLDENVEVAANKYIAQHKKLRVDTESVEVGTAKAEVETKLLVVKEFPVWIRAMTQLRKDVDPAASPEDLMRTARAASVAYAAIFDLGEEKLLLKSLGLNLSIQDLKDNITTQFVVPDEAD